MISLNTILKDGSPQELRNFISSCANNEDLAARLENDLAQLFSFVQNMKTEGNEQLAARLSMIVYKLTPQQLENPEIKKVETALRNRGMLNRNTAPDIALQQEEAAGPPIRAHKAVLALESLYFKGIAGFKEFQKGELVMQQMGISPWAFEQAVEYLYSSDEQRKNLISTIDKSLLFDMAKLADYWRIGELQAQCDEELCNSIGELAIEKSDLPDWLAQPQFTPKFTLLLGFLARTAGEGALGPIIEQMKTPAGAAQLAAKCTPKEIALFSTLKTEFGKACQIPPGTIGKAEWEKAFPVTIMEVPPLPAGIHAILEQKDPYESDKKLKETCQLFLRPKKVILHEEGGDRELSVSFDGVEELAKKAANPERRTQYDTSDYLRTQLNGMPVADSGWVLMRKEVIPGTRDQTFENQKRLLKGGFEVPKVMDAVLLNILAFASEGKRLYGDNPWSYTRCQEMCKNYQTLVGGFDSSGLLVDDSRPFDSDFRGLSGAWKF